ncbi:hypothetical protein SYNPS1DRAFT_26372 [Syncephalis pseudoplumigaleata]|uniref:PROP1-like PPR domain-containing protein n=1 Tax=Syncephalis pseudoplumigaleata TaxID=1712513 RepID=A0A4V1J2C0_9FUNG|nr:hypothetical protein SYNPS1DRAFT_26372 [Syncephalis pseudoplumigaleata]|eukprot:RKP28029.1 hypothetical protein SYNPS1DRAFT_26372 [Syncephalis pseudoplumigaleata]
MHSLLLARAVILRRAVVSSRTTALACAQHASAPGGARLCTPRPAAVARPIALPLHYQQERYYASRDDKKKGGQFQKKRRSKGVAPLYPTPDSIPPWLAIPQDADIPIVATSSEATTTTTTNNDDETATATMTEAATASTASGDASMEAEQLLLSIPPNEAWFYYIDLPPITRHQLPTFTVNQFLARLKQDRHAETIQRMRQVVADAETGKHADISTYNTLLHSMMREGSIDEAQLLLARIHSAGIKWNTVTYNVLLYGYTRANRHRDAKACFEKLRAQEDGIYPDAYSYTTMISAYCRRGLIADAENLITEMQTDGFLVNAQLEEIMLRGYAIANRIKTALIVLKSLEQRAATEAKAAKAGELPEGTEPYRLTPGVYNAILGAQWRAHPESPRIMELYKRMRSHGVRPNPMTYAITELAPDEGFSMMRSHDWKPTTQELNAFLNDALKANNFTGAFNIIREAAKEPAIPLDAVSYAILIDAQVKAHQIDEAFDLFKDMCEGGIAPDTVVYTTLLDACARAGDYTRARTLFDAMLTADANVRPNVYSYNVILGMLARRGDMKEAQRLIDEMPEHGTLPDVRSYNTLLTIYTARKDINGAWRLYEKMREQSTTPDAKTFATLMNLSVTSNDLAFGERVLDAALAQLSPQHRRIIAPMAAQLMQLYLDTNQAARAQAIWQQLRERNITPNQHCIAAVLHACIEQGHLSTAHTIWQQLAEEQIELHDRALTAYANVLLVEERWDEMLEVFKQMESIPSDETLVPFLDKLREAGRVEEANELLRSSRRAPSNRADRTTTTMAEEDEDGDGEERTYGAGPRSSTRNDHKHRRRHNYRQHER